MKITTKHRDFLKNYLFYFFSWTIMITLFLVVRYYDVNQEMGIQDPHFNWGKQIRDTFIIILLNSLLFVVLEPIISRKKWKKLPLFTVILFRSLFYFTFLFFVLSSLTIFENLTETNFNFSITWQRYTNILSGKRFQMILIYLAVANIFIQTVRLGIRLLGENVFWSYLRGKYFKPVEENRIFMFLDLKDSTTIAEKIGHIRFSELMQKFYYDISFPIKEHQAHVYQYVGDEVVLYWDLVNGLDQGNCLKCFFAIEKRIIEKKEKYNHRFGLVPEFKAAVHCGQVVTAEIGNFKSEIAFHGDVLNTTARIISKCNELESNLLISQELNDIIENQQLFNIRSKGKFLLRGKQQPINIYSVKLG